MRRSAHSAGAQPRQYRWRRRAGGVGGPARSDRPSHAATDGSARERAPPPAGRSGSGGRRRGPVQSGWDPWVPGVAWARPLARRAPRPYRCSSRRPMNAGRFDALVVGSGPAGSIAATVLARGGARVALVDKAKFPRDKACGDLVGPRGVQLLSDLGITIPGALKVDDMIVVGPTSHRVRLPCYPGRTYPGHGFALRRVDFDAALRKAAVGAGAEAFIDRAADPLWRDGGLEGFALSSGTEVRADIVIGADGASSRAAAGLGTPLGGDGISEAMSSGRAAAQAVLADPARPARRYRAYLASTYAPYHSTTAPVHAALLPRPRVVSGLGRALTAPALGSLLAPGWSIFWNDLVDGAQLT